MNQTSSAEIDSLVEGLIGAFNRKNAHDFAAQFTADASFIDVFGRRMAGRDDIEIQHRYPLEGPLADADLTVDDRYDTTVHPTVVVVDLSWRHRFGRGGDGRVVDERVGLLTLTTVHRDGRWQIALGHNVDYTNAFSLAADVLGHHETSSVPGTPGRTIVGDEDAPQR